MARMSGLEAKRASWSARIIYWFAKRNLGHVPAGMKILAYYPRLLRQHVRMNMLMHRKGELPSKLKRLAMLKTAMLIGCPF
jgi:hypothetical protein